jgi:hypothetical protein
VEYEATGKSRNDLLIKEAQPDLIEDARREHGEAADRSLAHALASTARDIVPRNIC